jgi:hypothetical protein
LNLKRDFSLPLQPLPSPVFRRLHKADIVITPVISEYKLKGTNSQEKTGQPATLPEKSD